MIIAGRTQHKNILFDGNSMSASLTPTYPPTCYTSIMALGRKVCYYNTAISGIRTVDLTSTFNSRLPSHFKSGDIVVFWEISNDAAALTSDTNGTQIAANVQEYCLQARNRGLKVVCLTGIARDYVTDDEDITSRIMACNGILRVNPSSYCDILVDVGALSVFDEKTDTTNTTYYNADLTHLTATGYNLIASTVYNALLPIL